MKLTMLEDYNNPALNFGNTLPAGEVFDIDDEVAARLIENGKAETVADAAAEDAAGIPPGRRGRKPKAA